ncbi:MAG TPA: twin-arginine translocation signal domain-containing protein [Pseudonocardiaceae bacterium]|nr:twin-arginine translocation signal domain-containing protein [Pseudonocardiaceae bacterium]
MSVTRRGFLQGSSAVTAAALAGMTFPQSSSAAVTPQATRTWLLASDAFANLNNTTLAGSPKVCQAAFNHGNTFFSVRYAGGNFHNTPVPAGYTGVAVLKFEAYQNGSTGLVDAIKAGLPSWVQAVQYDSEHWDFTPEIEQGAWLFNTTTQTSYAQLFCQTAHQHGLRVLLTPGNDLCNRDPNPAYPNSAPQYPIDSHDNGNDFNAFIRHDLASAAQFLQPGDLFEYQSQQLELDPQTFHSVTLRVSQEVAKANANGITFLAGLGRSIPPSDGATCAQLTAAANSAPAVTAGFWLNVGEFTDQVRPMICALKSLGF